jgi:hypothetical protein
MASVLNARAGTSCTAPESFHTSAPSSLSTPQCAAGFRDSDYHPNMFDAVEGTATDGAHRYSPSKVTGSERTVIRGRPAEEHISTSYVERFNPSSRMQMRRFPRLRNGFSKKLANHQAAIALWVCFYNLCRVHETLLCTPAMALGVSDHIWSIGELISAAQEPSDVPPLPPVETEGTLRPGYTPFRPYAISGGRAAASPRRRK